MPASVALERKSLEVNQDSTSNYTSPVITYQHTADESHTPLLFLAGPNSAMEHAALEFRHFHLSNTSCLPVREKEEKEEKEDHTTQEAPADTCLTPSSIRSATEASSVSDNDSTSRGRTRHASQEQQQQQRVRSKSLPYSLERYIRDRQGNERLAHGHLPDRSPISRARWHRRRVRRTLSLLEPGLRSDPTKSSSAGNDSPGHGPQDLMKV
ncbi:hypothetical protein F5Y19DRAFT_472452 [Xylariaceae sp. FL1651]|nr:hypothetical protein F5Y19DRAFT_472452 [Xylariaceae sp. FL1651]